MEYRKVYFRIRSRYQFDSGWPAETDAAKFHEESRSLFQSAGWDLQPGGDSTSDTVTAELNDGNSKIEEMKAEFNRIVSWSKIFDESPMEVKKMICGYIIKKVSVFRDYRVKIEFNINVEQFLNGIDSIDECATYELPMAQ